MSVNENLSPSVVASLMKQLRSLTHDAPEGISVYLRDDNLTSIDADINGPEDTPYENGVFRCKLVLAKDYPASPPKAYFTTKIFHPNVSKTGEICVNSLKKDWKPLLGIRHLLSVVRCLLIIPNPESALNEEAGKLLLENYADYAKRARLFTSIHARSKSAYPKQSAVPLQPRHQDEALTSANVSKPVDEVRIPGTSAHSMMPKASKKAVKKKSLKRL